MPDREKLVRLYELMTTIKQCDEKFRSLIGSGQLFFIYYSPRGQEAIAAAVGAALTAEDYLVTTYRGMHHHLAKGVSLRDLWAEFLGKAAGPCKGKGGPMHITDPRSGVMVTTGVVGSGLPIGVGLAMSSQLRGDGRVTVVTFGDGATNIGAFHEALNMAALWDLPVVFLCENNGYAESTARSLHQRIERISDRAVAYGLTGVTVDGNDPVAVYRAVRDAVARARAGEGPSLVEATTFRLFGHYFGDTMGYIPAEELQAAVADDPVPRFRSWLIESGHAKEGELADLEGAADAAIADAAEYAMALPPPDPEVELETDVYAEVMAL